MNKQKYYTNISVPENCPPIPIDFMGEKMQPVQTENDRGLVDLDYSEAERKVMYLAAVGKMPLSLVALEVKEGSSTHTSLVNKTKSKVQRNAPCPCGSGLKYKKCCRK